MAVELPALTATTKLTIGNRGNSPTLRMRLHGEALEKLRLCLFENGERLTAATELLSKAVEDGSEELFETAGKEAVAAYRTVIDTACGDGTSGKVIKWMADGDTIGCYDLALRLSPIVGWIAEQFYGVFGGLDGLSGQNDKD